MQFILVLFLALYFIAPCTGAERRQLVTVPTVFIQYQMESTYQMRIIEYTPAIPSLEAALTMLQTEFEADLKNRLEPASDTVHVEGFDDDAEILVRSCKFFLIFHPKESRIVSLPWRVTTPYYASCDLPNFLLLLV